MLTKETLDYKYLFESLQGLYMILDPAFRIITITDDYARATMTRREEVAGRLVFEVFPEHEGDKNTGAEPGLKASLDYVLANSTSHTMAVQPYHLHQPDGSIEVRYWSRVNRPVLDNQNRITYIIHQAEDVTELTRAWAGLREAEAIKRLAEMHHRVKQRLEGVLEAMGDAFVSLDRNWKYTFVNQQAIELMGKPKHELLGQSLWEVFPDIVNTEFETRYRSAMEEKLEQNFEVYYDSYKMWLSISVYPYEDGLAIFYNDITRLKENEKQIMLLNQELEQKVKLRTQELEESNQELESFTYSISHDLRTPLRAINGFAMIMEEDYGKVLDKEGRRLLNVIKENAEKMGLLIDDLLAFSRLGKKEIKKNLVDMNELVKAVVTDIQSVQPGPVKITIQPLHPAMADYALMTQVMINLVGNAIKYSSKKENPLVDISSEADDTWVTYKVSDNGVGFDMQYVHKLFGVFHRLHPHDEFPGTGVGLAIVARIVLKHGGKVWAEGKLNEGAGFYVALPKV